MRAAFVLGSELDRALVCGMGGSGIVADLAVALAARPVFAHHDFGVPGWCDRRTVVVASSYSGNTAEVLSAARAASDAGAVVFVATSGGRLLDEARRSGWTSLREIPAGLPPRYALGHLAHVTLEPLTHGNPPFVSFLGSMDPAVTHLRDRLAQWGPDVGEDDNQAKQIARQLEGTLPVIWGGPGVTGVAADRWRTDLNENAKVLAHSSRIPEACHNEVVGMAAEGREGRPRIRKALVCLRDADEDQHIASRFEAMVDEVRSDVDDVMTVEPQGPDPFVRFFDLAMLSGFVSVYLAILRGVDPGPIASIDRLKQSSVDH